MTYISLGRLKELKKELKERKTILRREISERIQEAQTLGDFIENAEYSEAREAQAFNEGQISRLERLINNAVVISDKKKKSDIVQLGSQIIAKNKKGGKFKFLIVGPEDANPIEGKISNESPLGKA